MSVNSNICDHLGQDYGKDYTCKSSVLNHKPYFTTTTLKFWLAKCSISISCICRHPTGTRQLAPAQNRAPEYMSMSTLHICTASYRNQVGDTTAPKSGNMLVGPSRPQIVFTMLFVIYVLFRSMIISFHICMCAML